YLLGQMRRPGEMTVISLKRTRDHASWIQRLLGLVDRRAPWLRRVVLLFLGALEFVTVTVPYVLELWHWAKSRKILLIHHNNGFDLSALILSYMLRVPLVAYQRGPTRASALTKRLTPRLT